MAKKRLAVFLAMTVTGSNDVIEILGVTGALAFRVF